MNEKRVLKIYLNLNPESECVSGSLSWTSLSLSFFFFLFLFLSIGLKPDIRQRPVFFFVGSGSLLTRAKEAVHCASSNDTQSTSLPRSPTHSHSRTVLFQLLFTPPQNSTPLVN